MGMKIDLRVETRPVSVHFECPHCNDDIEVDYEVFCSHVGELCDWMYTKFECFECGEEIEIYDVDMD